LFNKFENQLVGEMKQTVAEGIAIWEPKRMDDMIKAVKDGKGDVIAVDDEGIIKAQEMLREMGFYVEVTSGVLSPGCCNILMKDSLLPKHQIRGVAA
jgi:threonine synthase